MKLKRFLFFLLFSFYGFGRLTSSNSNSVSEILNLNILAGLRTQENVPTQTTQDRTTQDNTNSGVRTGAVLEKFWSRPNKNTASLIAPELK
jgi:hypothetical protein